MLRLRLFSDLMVSEPGCVPSLPTRREYAYYILIIGCFPLITEKVLGGVLSLYLNYCVL